MVTCYEALGNYHWLQRCAERGGRLGRRQNEEEREAVTYPGGLLHQWCMPWEQSPTTRRSIIPSERDRW